MPYKETIIHITILTAIAICAFWLVFQNGFPVGDDYKNQIIGFEVFFEQINSGDIYPRWLQNINHGFGGANLFFYPPFIYYIGYIIDLLSFHSLETLTVISITVLFFLILSGINCYLWLSSFCSRKAAIIGASFYMLAPYHLWIDVYERNNTAEFAAFAWLPLLFLLTRQELTNNRKTFILLSICYCLLLITHLPSAVFITPFLGLYKLLLLWQQSIEKRPQNKKIFSLIVRKQNIKNLAVFAASLTLGAALAGIYLYPALTMLGTVRSFVLWGGTFYDYSLWFLWPKNQCPGHGGHCNLMFLIALSQLIIPAILLMIVLDRINNKFRIHTLWLILLSLFCFFLMLPASGIIWEIFTPLQKIQFPYRILMLSDFFFASLIGVFFSALLKAKTDKKSDTANPDSTTMESIKTIKNLSIAAVIITPYLFLTAHSAVFVQKSWHPEMSFFDYRIKHRILTGEFFPNNKEMTIAIPDFVEMEPKPAWWLDANLNDKADDPAISSNGKGKKQTLLELTKDLPRKIIFKVSAKSPSKVNIRQFFFPGWQGYIKYKSGKIEQIRLSAGKPYGQISAELPQGSYDLIIIMPPMPQEKTGMIISLLGVVTIIFLSFLPLLKRRKNLKVSTTGK